MEAARTECRFIFVFGAPGAGKGTLCRRLAQDPDFQLLKIYHLSVGDYLRERKKEGSLPVEVAKAVAQQTLVTAKDMLGILKEKLNLEHANGYRLFILDGFPRQSDQMKHFLEQFNVAFAVFIDCPEEVALQRFLRRKDASREGDNEHIFRKRYAEFARNNPSLVKSFETAGSIITVDNSAPGLFDELEVYSSLKADLLRHPATKDIFGANSRNDFS